MDAFRCDVKNVTLKDIQKVISLVASITESTLHSHSLTLIIHSSGETTFTSSGCKLLSEINFSHPLMKMITNVAMNYTSLCGDDCKHFVFILHEVFNALHNRIVGNGDAYMRKKLINEIGSIKQILPCIFKSMRNTLNIHATDSDSFYKYLYSVVLTFMLSKFSANVSKMLSDLLCDFVRSIGNELESLKDILDYVVCHFDLFIFKVLSPVKESRVIKGLLFYRPRAQCLDLQNAKFVVIQDLIMKTETKDVSWKIANESFASQLNFGFVYQKVFEYFKSLGISLLITSSVGDDYIKTLCNKYDIFLIDRFEKEEVEYLLDCLQVHAIENLNESLEPKNIGFLSFVKTLSCNNSYFLHLSPTNPTNVLNVHHILLSAPCNAVWKEYYSECLNCFKLVSNWLKSNDSIHHPESFSSEMLDVSNNSNRIPVDIESKHCSLCSELMSAYKNRNKMLGIVMKSHVNGGLLMTPNAWKFLFKNYIKVIPDKLKSSCKNVLPALHLAIEKSLCKNIGVSLSHVNDFEVMCEDFFSKNKFQDVDLLEPILCKEIIISNIFDLILRLLKIDSIIFLK